MSLIGRPWIAIKMHTRCNEVIDELTKLDFEGKGEAFVEARFITPFLQCLGYERHRDYEIRRRGDDDMSFKLRYPPVEKGAQRIKSKHYNPDYMPIVRKKLGWIIEAKSAKDVVYPFHYKYIVQGLQYCIHPEIQAMYLVLTNGKNTAIYNPFWAVFNDGDMYQPVMSFSNRELKGKWGDIYEFLSVESIRKKIEDKLKLLYEKVAGSSLDTKYPFELLEKIGAKRGSIANSIENHVRDLDLKVWRKSIKEHQHFLESLDPSPLYSMMELPFKPGKVEGQWFVEKVFKEKDVHDVFNLLINDYERQSVFRKQQTFAALCTLYKLAVKENDKKVIMQFMKRYKDMELNLLNSVECSLIRLGRKTLVIFFYPKLKEAIKHNLKTVPEIERFVNRPTALSMTASLENKFHNKVFKDLLLLSKDDLVKLRDRLAKSEKAIEPVFKKAHKKLEADEIEVGNKLEEYGQDGIKHLLNRITDHLLP